MSDILDDLNLGQAEEAPVTPPRQENAPAPRRRGRPRKDDPTAPSNLKVTAKPPADVPMPAKGVIAEQMSQLHVFAAIPLMAFKPQTAQTLMSQSAEIGEAWETVARANPKVRAAILGMSQASTWGVLAMAYVPVIMSLVNEPAKEAESAPSADDALGERPSTGRHAAQRSSDPVAEVLRLV